MQSSVKCRNMENALKDYKYVLFDLDGTVIDSKEGIFNSARYTFEKMGWPLPPEEVLIKFIGPPLYKSFSAVDSSKTPEEAAEAVEIYREIYNRKGAYECRLYEGIERLIRDLKADGRKIILATAKSERSSILVLERLNMLKYFDFISGAAEDKSRNEKNEIILYAIDSLKINRDEAIMIGDRFYDAEGAKANGIDCIGAGWGYGNEQELLKSGAICVAKSVKDMYPLLKLKI